MKILITESQLNLINELDMSKHSMDRANDRIFNSDLITNIRYYINGTKHNREIGLFNIPAPIHTKIINNINFITNNVDNVMDEITFGVFLYKFTFSDIWNNTEFYDTDEINEIRNLIKYHSGLISIVDSDTNSAGTAFVAIVYNNSIITTYFTHNYSKEKLYSKLINNNNNNKHVIVLDSPEELEFYYENKDRDLSALH